MGERCGVWSVEHIECEVTSVECVGYSDECVCLKVCACVCVCVCVCGVAEGSDESSSCVVVHLGVGSGTFAFILSASEGLRFRVPFAPTPFVGLLCVCLCVRACALRVGLSVCARFVCTCEFVHASVCVHYSCAFVGVCAVCVRVGVCAWVRECVNVSQTWVHPHLNLRLLLLLLAGVV